MRTELEMWARDGGLDAVARFIQMECGPDLSDEMVEREFELRDLPFSTKMVREAISVGALVVANDRVIADLSKL